MPSFIEIIFNAIIKQKIPVRNILKELTASNVGTINGAPKAAINIAFAKLRNKFANKSSCPILRLTIIP